MPYTSLLTTSTADIKIVYGIDAFSGALQVEIPLDPAGNIMLVTGIARLQQDVSRWMLTPRGTNPINPTFGNPLWSLLGRPGGNVQEIFAAMMDQAEADFLAAQQQAAAQGFLTLDEQVDHFSDLSVTLGDNVAAPLGTVIVTFMINARSGTTAQAIVPFSIFIAA